MRHGPAARLGVFAGDGQDPGDLLGGELARRTAPGQVAQQSRNRVRQCRRLLAAFDQDQVLERIGPAVPPGADRMTFTPDMPGDVLVGEAIEGQARRIIRARWATARGQVLERTMVWRIACCRSVTMSWRALPGIVPTPGARL